MNSFPVSNKTRIVEIFAVVVTAVGKFVFMDRLNWRFLFITVAIILWGSYILYRGKTRPGIIRYWGFRKDNFKTVAGRVLPFALLLLIVITAIGFFRGTINITWHIIPILMLYPVWGIIQQFLLIALTAGNLQGLTGVHLTKALIIFLSALLFALVHYPFIWLIAGTFVLAGFYTWIYLQERNIYVLGIFHGWLGALFYYMVLGRDPFIETLGNLVHLPR